MPVYPPQNPQNTVTANVILNPSFELGITGPSDQIFEWLGAGLNQSFLSTQHHTGTHSILTIQMGACYQNFNNIPVANIPELSYWTKCTGLPATHEATIIITYADLSTTSINLVGNGDGNWHKIDVTANLNAGKSVAQVNFIGLNNDPLYLDDVTLTAPANIPQPSPLFYPPQS